MAASIVTITTHLSEKDPPDHERLRIALEKLITALYGEASTLTLIAGHTKENPNENMLNIKAPMSSAIMHALGDALKQLFGVTFAIGYTNDSGRAIRPDALKAKVAEIKEIFEELDNSIEDDAS